MALLPSPIFEATSGRARIRSPSGVCRVRPPLDLHVVRYERVVENLEGEARALTSFLDLPYSPAMLEFRKTAASRIIHAPSARQVIKPLYRQSVGRWRNYARALEPVLPVLNAWAAHWDYPA